MIRVDELVSTTGTEASQPDGHYEISRLAATPTWLAVPVGFAAVGFSALYTASDILEIGQGHFSSFRLALTYASEAAIPLFVLGLYALQRPHIGRLGLFGAVAYAYSYVFFTSTVVYALVAHTPDYQGVTKAFGVWMTIHGLIMIIGGVTFGAAVVRAHVYPRWTGACLALGVVLVAIASGLPTLARTLAEAVAAAAFIGMGTALLRGADVATSRDQAVAPAIADAAPA